MEVVDFVNKTGKNIGGIQNTKLSNFLGATAKKIRYLKQSNELMFESLYLGAFCKANYVTKEDLIELIKQNTRRFAKRQLTWFRRDEQMKWFEPHETTSILTYIEENRIRNS